MRGSNGARSRRCFRGTHRAFTIAPDAHRPPFDHRLSCRESDTGVSPNAPDPVRKVTDPGVITTRQTITPIGVSTSVFTGKVQGLSFGIDTSEIWVLTSTKVFQLDWKNNRIISKAELGGVAGIQSIRYYYPFRMAFVGVTINDKVQLASVSEGRVKVITSGLGRTQSGALAICAKRNLALVPLLDENQLAVVDLSSGEVQKTIDAERLSAFGAVVNAEGSVAYVSNWGGRRPNANDLVGLMGYRANPAAWLSISAASPRQARSPRSISIPAQSPRPSRPACIRQRWS